MDNTSTPSPCTLKRTRGGTWAVMGPADVVVPGAEVTVSTGQGAETVAIASVGRPFRHAGRSYVYGYRAASSSPYASDAYAPVEITRNAAGEVIATRNRRGRCEDAPCCGCCSY